MRIQILILGFKGLNGILSDVVLCCSGAGKSLVCFSSYSKRNFLYFFVKEVEGRFILVEQELYYLQPFSTALLKLTLNPLKCLLNRNKATVLFHLCSKGILRKSRQRYRGV